MVSLTNPVNKQNIVDRFSDYVVATANSGIIWANNAYPFAEWDKGDIFGGSTSGRTTTISGTNIAGGANQEITAQFIYDTLIGEAYNYTSIRNMRAVLNVGGGGGNTGSRPSPGVIFDQTQKAYMTTASLQTITSGRGDVESNNVVTSAGLEVMLDSMRANYNTLKDNSVGTYQTDVCHASCHSSCHSSRGRR